MNGNQNQHFVPQFYFRFFSKGESHISMVRLPDGRFIPRAPIKGQCARHKFYGFDDIEKMLSVLEGHHASALRKLLRIAWGTDATPLSGEEWFRVLQAVLIQRERTPRSSNLRKADQEHLTEHAFLAFLKHSGEPIAERALKAFADGEVHIEHNPLGVLLFGIDVAMRSAIGISDLSSTVIRNHTPKPFIFGDSPVAFYNLYRWGRKSRGSLGLQSEGLIILFPLDSQTQLLLYDRGVYAPIPNYTDVFNVSEISQLNAVQIHSALDNVYFGSATESEYVCSLVKGHKPLIKQLTSQFRVYKAGAVLIDGVPSTGEVIHSFEPQINLHLDLPFLKIDAPPCEAGTMKNRNKEISRILREEGRLHIDQFFQDSGGDDDDQRNFVSSESA